MGFAASAPRDYSTAWNHECCQVIPELPSAERMRAVLRDDFREAARFFLETVARIPPEGWSSPGLGTWSVRELVAHTSHTFESLKGSTSPARTAALVELQSPAESYAKLVGAGGKDDDIAERGREGGRALGDDPADAIRRAADEALDVLDDIPDDHPTRSVVGGIRFIDWLATRVVELTVHTLDLAGATGMDVKQPPGAMRATLAVLSETAVAKGYAAEMTMAATGRRPLRDGFTLFD